MRTGSRDRRPVHSAHRRNTSAPTIASPMMMTPPFSPPQIRGSNSPTPSIPNSLRRPIPAHLNLSMNSPSYTQLVVAPNRHSQPPRSFNPYEIPEGGEQLSYPLGPPPPDYGYIVNSFDLSSAPASPLSPQLHPAYPLAGAGDESFFDRWLRHEAMGRPIFPPSRTGSSIATSDISSIRGGMFGSLPGGRATGPSSRRGPASEASAATRDRDNFTTSAPSYPSSRAGASRPTSRDGDEPGVDGESYAPSVVSSESYPPSIDARLRYAHQAPPPAPTPPTSSMAPSTVAPSDAASVMYRDESASGSVVTLPENAATRPPRYSDSLAAPPYQLDMADLLTNGVVGYQNAPIVTYGAAAETEKAILGGMLSNRTASTQSEGTVVMVREDVWRELRRRAGLDESPLGNAPYAGAGGVNPATGAAATLAQQSLNRRRIKEKRRDRGEEARCCGVCVIC